jgi:hypothetical protein
MPTVLMKEALAALALAFLAHSKNSALRPARQVAPLCAFPARRFRVKDGFAKDSRGRYADLRIRMPELPGHIQFFVEAG